VLGKKTPLESRFVKYLQVPGEAIGRRACVIYVLPRPCGISVNGVDGYVCVHDHRVVVVCAPTIVSWRCRPEMPDGRDSDIFCEMLVQVPREALEIAGTSINFRSGKFGYSICPIFSKGHAEIFREI